MAATFPNCANCNDCDDLLDEIIRRMWSRESGGSKGLVTRFVEQVFGCQTPADVVSSHPSCAGHRMQGTWNGHNEAMKTQQGRLRGAIDDYDDNDCGDEVGDKDRARNVMRQARRAAYSSAVPVGAGDYKGPPAPADAGLPRTMMQRAQDGAQSLCVGGFTAGGAVVGGAGGAVAGAGAGGVIGGAVGGGGGTLVAPGPGTIVGGAGGVATGTVIGGVVGAGAGGYVGADVGNDLGEWICR